MSDLGAEILKALKASRFLVVLCSKHSAKSKWVNKEIEDFKALGKGDHILALILDGEPNATTQGRPDEECFPPALRFPAEPIAGDLRKEGDGKERGFLKVLAGIAQLDFDKIYRRHERAQARKRMIVGSVAMALIAIFAALFVFAITANMANISNLRKASNADLASARKPGRKISSPNKRANVPRDSRASLAGMKPWLCSPGLWKGTQTHSRENLARRRNPPTKSWAEGCSFVGNTV